MRKSSKVVGATKRTRHDIRASIFPGAKIGAHQHFLYELRSNCLYFDASHDGLNKRF
jgi:hypothetical protein